jgi:phosphoribosylamine--glycine ligase
MRVLLVCASGDGLLDIGIRAKAYGHEVRHFLRTYDRRTRPVGDGLLDRVEDWRAHVDWADLVICESNGLYLAELEGWKKQRGKMVIGGTVESAAWELDRKKGMEVFRKAGIPTAPFREFTDYDAAIAFVEKRGEVFYSKPCSDTADKSLSAKTGVSEDPSWMLRKWKKKHGRPPCPFLLQESIKGIEFAVGAWFGPGGFAYGIEENFEEKRMFAGDLGPNVGEAGTVMRYVRRSKLFDKMLAPLEEGLARLDYVGNVDVNCIVDEDGHPWPLEFTMRCGWPSTNIEQRLMDWDFCEFLAAVASGESTRGAHIMDAVAVGVVLALPPYPHPPRDYAEIIGIPIYHDPEIAWHPCESRLGEDEVSYITAGGYAGVVTGIGPTVRSAARSAYRSLAHISMPASPYWRNDIGLRLKKELPVLRERGFASLMEY